MSRELFAIEKGIQLVAENTATGVKVLFGSGAPAIEAEIGSLYLRSDVAEVYKKIDTGADASDWEILPDNTDVAALITLSGMAAGSVNFGAFTGTVLPDNETLKNILQALGTQVDTNTGNISTISTKVDNLITLSGVAANEPDLGAFTGSTIPDDSTIKGALQALETAVEDAKDDIVESTVSAVEGTATMLDEFLVDNFCSAEWLLTLWLDSAPAQRVTMKVIAQHDGTASADAVNVDDSVYAKLKLGAAFTYAVTVALSGSSTTQKLQLKVAGATSAAISARASRISVSV